MSETDTRPPFPVASDYSGHALKRFRAGVAAAKRYYAAIETREGVDYCAYVERADARDEPSAWYDGWDSVCNPHYFEGH
jgi:hypothetical protein